ncbi:hypothetical protein [Streptomyces brevispora]
MLARLPDRVFAFDEYGPLGRDPVHGARIFANAGYSGPQVYLGGNGYVYNMAEAGLNDVASSHCFTNVSGCS